MDSNYNSEDIKRLTYSFVKALIENTDGELKVAVKFVDIYNDACRFRGSSNEIYSDSDVVLIQNVRESLLNNGYFKVDSNNSDSIFLTQRAIEEYSDY